MSEKTAESIPIERPGGGGSRTTLRPATSSRVGKSQSSGSPVGAA